jgi:hypothetical protein
MDFGIFLDFILRAGGTPEAAFQETMELVSLAESSGGCDQRSMVGTVLFS